jgi:hypothetical protein
MPRDSVPIEAIEFRGLIGNKTWDQITGPEFLNALARCGWREAHNAHIFLRLCERGPRLCRRSSGRRQDPGRRQHGRRPNG